jgi:hypothetical protein
MATTTQRGLGAEHQTERRRQMTALLDRGPRPCRRCGHPMVHPRHCTLRPDRPDGRCFHCRLDLGHDQSRALGGQGPLDLEHARCNRQAGARLRNALYRPRRTRSVITPPRW